MPMATLDELELTADERRFLGLPSESHAHVVDLTLDDDDGPPGAAGHMPCEICRDELGDLDPTQRQLHYDAHFNDPPPEPNSMASRMTRPVHDKESIFWSPKDPVASAPKNFTPAPISVLKRALLKTHHSGATVSAVICREGVCHVKTEKFDMMWGCGYRNFMMACTALIMQTAQPQYRELLYRNGDQPGVRKLQQWLEEAWNCGYDPPGAAHFNHRILGTKKWIGTGDLYPVFSYLGIPARLVDFRKTGDAPRALIEWIKNYFTAARTLSNATSAFDVLQSSPIVMSDKLPIILQHAGHSRTVIGYECDRKRNINLLMLDPAKSFPAELRRKAIELISGTPTPSPSKGAVGSLVTKFLKRSAADDDEDRSVKRARDEQGSPIRTRGGDEGNPNKTVEWFRVNLKNLSRKDEYQVLYFPMEAPLSVVEQERRKRVMSEIGC